MNERFVNVFVDGLMNYIKHLEKIHADVGTPYLLENTDPILHEVTGIIGVSGTNKGCVYFTATRAILRQIATIQGDDSIDDGGLLDLAGEIANTIAGNARSVFGKQFMISVPSVVEGNENSLHLPADVRSFAIPIEWGDFGPVLIVCLDKDQF